MYLRQIGRCYSARIIKNDAFKYLKPGTSIWLSYWRQQSSQVNFSNLIPILQKKLFGNGEARSFCGDVNVDIVHKLYKTEMEEFLAAREVFYKALTEEENKSLTDVVKWYSKVYEYNLKGGKRSRGTAVLTAYKTLSNNVTAEGLRAACILGWCLELLQAFFLVADDIMDQSILRRGEPCWYRKPEVGLIAVNDSLLLQSGVFKVLRKCFGTKEFYNKVVQEFLQATEKTTYGQCLDMLNNPPHGKPKFEQFTFERYKAIVEFKTSYYTFCLPIHLAMHLIGNRTVEEFEVTRDLSLKLGLLFQIQDDYLDCYGNPEVTGKFGTDIAQGKCTWFAATFLELAKEDLKEEWMANYGIDNEKSVSKVVFLYGSVNMLEKYLKFEKELHSDISYFIKEKLKNKSMQELFSYLLNKMYRRKM